MVQFFNLPQRPSDRIAEQLGMNLGQGMNQLVQQQYQRGLLQDAFKKLNPEGNFLEQLKSIAPTLLTTPGGSQALGELAPLLGKYANNAAVKQFIQSQKSKQNPSSSQAPIPQMQEGQQNAIKPQAPSGEEYYRNPEAYASPESIYPERVSGPQPQPEMSAEQIRQGALDLMEASSATGNPIPYNDALNTVTNQNNATIAQNQRIESQKEAQEQAQEKLTEGMVNRAANSGLIKAPEDKTVAQKLAIEALREPNKAKKWEYVRTGMRQWNNAKAGVQRAGDLSGPFQEIWRKGMDTYKDKKTLMNNVQPDLKFYKEHGLFDEARADLQENLGFGSDDVERTLFPPSKEEQMSLNSFPHSPIKESETKTYGLTGEKFKYKEPFPGEKFQLEEKDFEKFKSGISDYLTKNPKTNLVTTRTELNQDKRYAWQDISRAIEELIEEGAFIPDRVQEQQLNVIQQAPLPGLSQFFNYYWTGAK